VGAGEQVVLIHGIAADGGKWSPLIKLLPKNKYRVVAPDLLGFGESPRPEWNTYTVNEHARAVVATLKRRHVRGPVVLVGHSMGCLIAAHIAARDPKLVRRLVLYEPPLFADLPQDYPKHTKRRSKYFAFFSYLAQHPQLAATQGYALWRLAKRLAGFALSEERWIPFERSLRNTIMEQTAYHELHEIQLPTAIVHGRLDFVVIRTELQKMFVHNPNISLHKVTDSHALTPRSARYLAKLIAAD